MLVHLCVQVAGDLRGAVQRLYVETLRRLDSALAVICADFDPVRYSKVRGCVFLPTYLPVHPCHSRGSHAWGPWPNP